MQKNKTLSSKAKLTVAASGVVVIALAGVFIFHGSAKAMPGVSYLQQQKTQDADSIKTEIYTLRQQEMQKKLEEGSIQIFDLFQDYLMLGDSRVVGYASYGFMPEGNVLADAGHTVLNITDWLDVIKERQPKNLIFSYGVNDMGLNIGEGAGGEGYDTVYENQIKAALEADPGAHVYVNSIIPATPQAVEESPRWGKTDEFNAKIKAMCERNGWTYIDNFDLIRGDLDAIYAGDGIHFNSGFYTLWAENIYQAIEKTEAGQLLQKTDSTQASSAASSVLAESLEESADE